MFIQNQHFGGKLDLSRICDFLVLDRRSLIEPLYLQRFMQSNGNCDFEGFYGQYLSRAIILWYFLISMMQYDFYILLEKVTPRSFSWCRFLTDGEGPNQPRAIFVKFCEICEILRNFEIFNILLKITFFAPLPPTLYKHNGLFGLFDGIFTKI